MVDVFISYAQREPALMLPIKQRLEALGLILFVDVDGRLDGEATFPEALDKGVRASKAVIGCWSPWALCRPWVRKECAFAMSENKLVAAECVALSNTDVPLQFIDVERKQLLDFDGANPHEGWVAILRALATKLKLWVEKSVDHPEVAAVRQKIVALEKAIVAERAALDAWQPLHKTSGAPKPLVPSTADIAWAGIERSLEASHYRRFERAFEHDPAAFLLVIEAEARAKALERWAATDRENPEAVAETLRTGLFPALQEVAEHALARAEDSVTNQRRIVQPPTIGVAGNSAGSARKPDGEPTGVPSTKHGSKNPNGLADKFADTTLVPQVGHSRKIRSFAFIRNDEFLVSASEDGTIRLWGVENGDLWRTTRTNSAVLGLFQATNGLVAVTENKILDVHPAGSVSLRNSIAASRIVSPASDALGISISVKAGSFDSGVNLFRDGAPRRFEPNSEFCSIALSPDGTLFAAGEKDSTINIWNTADGSVNRTLSGHKWRDGLANGVEALAFESGGQRLASGGWDGLLILWDTATGDLLATLHHPDCVWAIAFEPAGRLFATGCRDGKARIWCADSYDLVATLDSKTFLSDWVRSVAFSSDGKSLAVGRESGRIEMWSASSFQLIWCGEEKSEIETVKISSNRHFIACTQKYGRCVHLWSTQTGQMHALKLKDSSAWVRDCIFSPDGRRIIVAFEGHVGIWDSQSLQLIAQRKIGRWECDEEDRAGSCVDVVSLTISGEGDIIAVHYEDKVKRAWKLESLVANAECEPVIGELPNSMQEGTSLSWRQERWRYDFGEKTVKYGEGQIIVYPDELQLLSGDNKIICRLLSFDDDEWIAIGPDELEFFASAGAMDRVRIADMIAGWCREVDREFKYLFEKDVLEISLPN